MAGYTKLFQSILDSTIWQESSEAKILWITMLAMSDFKGQVMASIPGLARRAGIPLADCEASLQRFLSPDAYSRTPDNEGRRIAVIDGGWQLLNHAKYRALLNSEDRKEYNRVKQQEHRARIRQQQKPQPVNDSQLQSLKSEQGEHISSASAFPEVSSAKADSPPLQGDAVEKAKAKQERAEALKALSLRIGAIAKRKPSTPWVEKEKRKLASLYPIPEEDIAVVERYYGLSLPLESDYRRRDLSTLLNNWPGEVDRSNRHFGAAANGHAPGPEVIPAAEWIAFLADEDHSGFRRITTPPSTIKDLPPSAKTAWEDWRRRCKQP